MSGWGWYFQLFQMRYKYRTIPWWVETFKQNVPVSQFELDWTRDHISAWSPFWHFFEDLDYFPKLSEDSPNIITRRFYWVKRKVDGENICKLEQLMTHEKASLMYKYPTWSFPFKSVWLSWMTSSSNSDVTPWRISTCNVVNFMHREVVLMVQIFDWYT